MSKSVLYRYVDAALLDRLEQRTLQPRQLVLGNLAGGHPSPLSGFAVEFAGHREYVPGDDPKHIDWRVYFNRDKFVTKQYELETNFVCHLLLDASESMAYGAGESQKLQVAVRMAVSLAHCMVRQRDKVALATFAGGLRQELPPSNTMEHLIQIAQRLAQLTLTEPSDLGSALYQLGEYSGRRSIVIALSDCFTDLNTLNRGLQRHVSLRNEVLLFQIVHPDECDFPFHGDFEFVGLEGEDRLRGSAEDMRQYYLDAWPYPPQASSADCSLLLA
jgi:uncharacterized protein (DUF58 family)